MKINQMNKLATMLGMGAFTGAIPTAALTGFFKPENAFLIAVLFMAGPGAITTALLLDGNMKERIFSALLAGAIATIIVVFAAGIGTKALGFFNLNVLKIFGGIAVLVIGLLIMGVKINDKIPFIVMLSGIVLGGIFR